MTIGIVLVSYNTGAVLLDCLESLLAAARAPGAPDLRVLVVDNASPDGTLARLRRWAQAGDGADAWSPEGRPFTPRAPRGPVTLDVRNLLLEGRHETLGSARDDVVGVLEAGSNDGFAAGVNRGLETFRAMAQVDTFWILNSDAMTEDHTPAVLERAAIAAQAEGGFGVIGGRTFYTDPPLLIQTDGGRVDLWTGRLLPATLGKRGRDVPGPARADLDYIPGCHMLVSRAFLDRAGLMPEGYFLYFEEIDWCMRRGDLPLIWVEDAPIHHHSGASIGSQSWGGGMSTTAAYWMFRNRMRFVRRWNVWGVPTTFLYSVFKIAKLRRGGHRRAAAAAWRGVTGRPFAD